MRLIDYENLRTSLGNLKRVTRNNDPFVRPMSLQATQALKRYTQDLNLEFERVTASLGPEDAWSSEERDLGESARACLEALRQILQDLDGLEEKYASISATTMTLKFPVDQVHEQRNEFDRRDREQAWLNRRVVVTTSGPGRPKRLQGWRPL